MHESLVAKITEYFPKRRESIIKNILILSLCILHKETICLNRLKSIVSQYTGKLSKPASNYKRLIRIFDNNSLSNLWLELLKFAFLLLRLQVEELVLDGTSWKRGERWFHYMTLCIVYKGVAIPIYWEDLAKHGISNYEERERLLSRALKYFNLEGLTLLADREYIGLEWFKLLIGNEINFNIRLKKNIYKDCINACKGLTHEVMTQKIMRSKLPNKTLSKLVELKEIPGQTFRFVATKNPKKDPKDPVIYLLTNVLEKSAKAIAYQYCKRTKIEHCFKHLKSNGFNLEQINLRTKSRCRLLMAVTVFTYVLSIHEGLKEYDKIPMKIYNENLKEKAVSVFRNGLNRIFRFTLHLDHFCQYIIREVSSANRKYQSPFSINV